MLLLLLLLSKLLESHTLQSGTYLHSTYVAVLPRETNKRIEWWEELGVPWCSLVVVNFLVHG